MNKYYIFQVNGSKSLKPFEATVGKSLMHNRVTVTGPSFALEEENGILYLAQENKRIAKTSRIIERQVYRGKDVDISYGRHASTGVVIPDEVVVYKTKTGSEYVFIPENACLRYASMNHNANQKDMEYLEGVAAEYYDKTTFHPTTAGKEAFLSDVKKKASERGYHKTLSELKDMYSTQESSTRERDVSIYNPQIGL